jgi:PAS domain S-box-containing protein
MTCSVQPITGRHPENLGHPVPAPVGSDVHSLLELSQDGVFIADTDGVCTYVNAAGCVMLGYRRDEVIGRSLFDLIVPGDGARLRTSNALTREGRPDRGEWMLRRKEGTWLPAQINANVLPNGQWQGFVRDMSWRQAQQAERDAWLEQAEGDRRRLHDVEQKLRASERLFRTVFELLPVGLWLADAEGNLVLGNPAGERVWGGRPAISPDRYASYEGWWVDSGQPIPATEWGLARAIRRGETTRRELIRIKCLDGSLKTIINWAAPIRGEAGEIAGAVAVNEDVTVLHQTQEQLRAAVRDREQLLAVVAHDLRTPLNALALRAAYLQLKARSIPGGDDVGANALAIEQITRAMSGLVDDLLAISASGSGHSLMKFTTASAAEVVAKAAEAARPLFGEAGLELVVLPMGELPPIHIDVDRVLRVFANLFDNALKFTKSPGQVMVRAEPAQGSVRFCVGNTGPALPADQMESMFRPFWQAGREDRRGAGLGLSICRSIIEAHGGSIWTEPAHGMRLKVCFALPCV